VLPEASRWKRGSRKVWARHAVGLDDVVGHRIDPALFVDAIFLFQPDVRVGVERHLPLFLHWAKMDKANRFPFGRPNRPVAKYRVGVAELEFNGH
jgi:hypothetical protein